MPRPCRRLPRIARSLAGLARRRGRRAAGSSAVALALALAPQLPMLAAHASAVAAGQPAIAPVTISITSMTPDYARPGQKITVVGYVRNRTSAAVRHLTVGLSYSRTALLNRDDVSAFAAGDLTEPEQPAGPTVTIARLPGKATRWWRIRLRASALQLSCFGVYPLSAQVSGVPGGEPVAPDPTLLPYWPATTATCAASPQPVPDDIAWIWPLIDQPQQGACTLAEPQPQLLDNSLAASLSRRGRLGGLLAAGLRYARRAQLTWVLDPALLASARLMEQPYQAGGGAGCGTAASYPASRAAKTWLAHLIRGTARQPLIVTPYDDVDVAALAPSRLNDSDLRLAFAQGWQVAQAILHRKFDPAAAGDPAQRLLDATVWPADGIANYSVLENITAVDQTGAVILGSSTMPPSPAIKYTPSAVTSTADATNGNVRVLLSDDVITALLGTPGTAQPAAAFAVRQLYLGQTAMFAAEAPADPRAIVVAPPRRWNPSASLAGDLLAATVSAPWLRPTSAAALLASRPGAGSVARQPPRSTSPAALGGRLLRQIGSLDQQVQLLENLGVPGSGAMARSQQLERAVFAIESSAWRGTSQPEARALLRGTGQYIRAELAKLTVDSSHRVTLGGLGGNVFVSISNRLGFPVRARLVVARLSNPTLTTGSGSITVPHGGLIDLPSGQFPTVRIKINAVNAGSTVIRIRLESRSGVPLPNGTVTVSVRATHYGRLALVIGAVALAIFMITSATRAIRRDPRGDDGREEDGGGAAGDGTGDGTGEDGAAGDRDGHGGDSGGGRTSGRPGATSRPGNRQDPVTQVSALESAGLGTP